MLIVAVCGGSASGKTIFCKQLSDKMRNRKISVYVMSQDNFYKNLPDDVDSSTYNFDSPDALNFDIMKEKIFELKYGQNEVCIPLYDFTIHKAVGTHMVKSCDVLIIEGILLFSQEEICKLADIKVYVKASPVVRFARRIRRDVLTRGRTIETVIDAYLKFVEPSYEKYIAPNESLADITVHNDTNDGDHVIQSKINIIDAYIEGHLSKLFSK